MFKISVARRGAKILVAAVAWTLVSFGLAVPVVASQSIERIVYEGFDYTDGAGADLLDGASGGQGWTNAWDWTYSVGSSLQVGSPGLTYSGLTTTGNRADFYNQPGGNQIAQIKRSLSVDATGVVYFQILTSGISNSNGSSGGGTPRIAFSSNGVGTAWLGGNGAGTPTNMSLLNADGNAALITSANRLDSANLLTILRIDYSSGTTSMWTNPNMSTFDYLDPPTAEGTTSLAFSFDSISILIRQGSLDEISVLRVVETPEDPSQRPPDWMKQYARSSGEQCQAGWNPSWAEWPNDGRAGFVCVQVLTWSHRDQSFVIAH